MYGCHNDHDEEKRHSERVFPFLLSQRAPELFFFSKCQFKVQKSKEGTGRV